jgi:hypothetical protein
MMMTRHDSVEPTGLTSDDSRSVIDDCPLCLRQIYAGPSYSRFWGHADMMARAVPAFRDPQWLNEQAGLQLLGSAKRTLLSREGQGSGEIVRWEAGKPGS